MAVPVFNLAPGLIVSRLCLGTMTFGEQNTQPHAFQLLDSAFAAGINFFDSAEMYPVPQRPETQGRSEECFGAWIKNRKIPRDRVVFATKVSGPSGQMSWIRNGPESLNAWNITEAIDNSLMRLQTDYIDLYQIHWPDRYVPMFGETEYDPDRCISYVGFEEQLGALGRAVDAGKIRYVGLSNETPFGVMKFLQVAGGSTCYPRIVSVQNSYNLLCRSFESGMAECCHHERVSLLAYSPLAMGILSGKYLSVTGGPSDARLNLFRGKYAEGESRYNLGNNNVKEATKAYVKIAEKYGVHPVSLAIGFVLRNPLVASAVFGVTKLWQLQEVLNACRVNLGPDIIADINKVHLRRYMDVGHCLLDGNADAVEFCPHDLFQHILAASTYTLQEGEKPTRAGSISLFEVDALVGRLELACRTETAGIFDIKWNPKESNFGPLLAQGDAAGYVRIHKLETESSGYNLREICGENISSSMCLCLDWSPSSTSIISGLSDGSVSLLSFHESRVTTLQEWKAHDFEVWAASFDTSQPHLVYTGSDDCKFSCYDVRDDPSNSVFQNTKTHKMGVCCISKSPHDDNTLLTGSYDENLRVWDIRSVSRPLNEGSICLGGGVWRIKHHPSIPGLVLTACMHNGFAIVKYTDNSEEAHVIETYDKHGSLAYGADWQKGKPYTEGVVATCSFYDKMLRVWTPQGDILSSPL